MASRYKHHKAYRCRIEITGRIYQLKENSKISMPMKYPLEKATAFILDEYPKEDIIIKSDKGGGSEISNGEIIDPYIIDTGARTVKGSTEWLRLIKSDGTIWTITNDHHVGKQIQ